MMKNNIIFCLAICLAVLFNGCSEPVSEPNGVDPNAIRIESQGVATVSSKGSRAVVNEQFSAGSVLGVFAFNLPNGIFDETFNSPDLLYNASVTKLSEKEYIYSPIANWPDVGKVRYFAYHPHSSTLPEGTIVPSVASVVGSPTIRLDLSKAHGKVDFSTSSLPPITPFAIEDPSVGVPLRSDYFVNFHFKRRLCELSFRAKAVDMPPLVNIYIHSISLINVYKSGVYNFFDDTWSNLDGLDATSGATLTYGSTGVPISKLEYVDIINPGNTDGSNREASVVMFPAKHDVMKLSILFTLEYMKPAGGCEYRIVGTKVLPFAVDWNPSTVYTYDIECGYHEASGESADFTFTIAGWKSQSIDTVME